MRDWVKTVTTPGRTVGYEPEEFIDAGACCRRAARPRSPTRYPRAHRRALLHVFEMRDGRIQRGTAYLDRAEALEPPAVE